MNDYINLVFQQLSAAIGYAFLGLGIGGLIVFLLKRKGYLDRGYLILRIITKFYYLLFPVVFFLYFWFVGSLWITKSLFQESVEEVIIIVQDELYPSFASHINDQIKDYISLDEIPSNLVIVQNYLSIDSLEQESGFYEIALKYTLVKILDLTIGDDISREKRATALSNGISTSAFEYGIDFLKSQVDNQIRQTFIFSLIPLTVIFFGILFLPAIEIFISTRFLKHILKNSVEEGK